MTEIFPRMLKPSETIERGDEYLHFGEWYPAQESDFGKPVGQGIWRRAEVWQAKSSPIEWTKSSSPGADKTARVSHHTPCRCAGGYDGAHEITSQYLFNGSGPKAFGGADKWPAVRAEWQFEAGQEEQRDKFVEALKQFTTDFFSRRQRRGWERMLGAVSSIVLACILLVGCAKTSQPSNWVESGDGLTYELVKPQASLSNGAVSIAEYVRTDDPHGAHYFMRMTHGNKPFFSKLP